MTTTVQVIVNGPNYVTRFKTISPEGRTLHEGMVRGHPDGGMQGLASFHLGQGCTVEMTEAFEPKDTGQ